MPSFAVDPRSGRLYAVWADNRFGASSHVDHVVLSSSNPGGRRWSAPRRLDPPSAALGLIPSVAVGADGSVAVTYFTVAPKASRVTYWAARSHDAGRTFTRSEVGEEFSLADAPFLTGIPAILVPGGLFLGDYMGLASSGTTFLALYVRTTAAPANPTDVFLARIPAGAPGAASVDTQAKRVVERDGAFRARVSENIARALEARGRPLPGSPMR